MALGVAVFITFLSVNSINAYTINDWHAWGAHGATISEAAGVITANTPDTDGSGTVFHWNKSSWETRTGSKAFYSTSALNGMTVGSIIDITYNVNSGYWGNAYFNIMVEDENGKRAILAPSKNSETSSGWITESGNMAFSVFEAETGWTGTSSTGWYAADFDAVKNLIITNGPFTEFPDTLGGTATAQDDPVYVVGNWAAWADQSAGADLGWEQDGLMITFGQSTGTDTPATVLSDLEVNVVPIPGAAWLMASGLFALIGIRRRGLRK